MEFEKKKVKSTSSHTAEVEPVVIRETTTTRLVFKPMMVDNKKKPRAALRGDFIYQRKGRNDKWEDINEVKLNELKSGEGVSLTLKSEELLKFLKEIVALYKLYHEEGINFGEVSYIKTEANLQDLSQVSEEDFKKFVDLNTTAGAKIFNKFLNWVTEADDKELIIKKLTKLESGDLNKLNTLVNLSALKNSLMLWENNKQNSDEEFWQKKFLDNPFLLNALFNFPVLIIDEKAYVRGKRVTNRDGNVVDFLCKNKITKNAVLIEIKTPTTPLLGAEYRNNTYNLHKELSGSVVQILNYKQTVIENSHAIRNNSSTDFDLLHPKCIVITGTTEDLDDEEIRSFELFRNNLNGVEIITYDELFQKTESFLEIMQS